MPKGWARSQIIATPPPTRSGPALWRAPPGGVVILRPISPALSGYTSRYPMHWMNDGETQDERM
jgi:hypothetical protein